MIKTIAQTTKAFCSNPYIYILISKLESIMYGSDWGHFNNVFNNQHTQVLLCKPVL